MLLIKLSFKGTTDTAGTMEAEDLVAIFWVGRHWLS